MSDRCYIKVECRPEDQPHFDKLGFGLLDMENGAAIMEDSEGTPNDLEKVPKGVPYVGFHGSGCEYGPYRFACDGTTFLEMETDYDGFVRGCMFAEHETEIIEDSYGINTVAALYVVDFCSCLDSDPEVSK